MTIGRLIPIGLILLVPVALAVTPTRAAENRVARQVRDELVMLPNYGLFDHLTFREDGTKVTLFGMVTQAALKSEAEEAVKHIEGVATVENRIEVLPASPDDDRIRLAVYRAVYSCPQLHHYQLAAIPPIHIIVKNANLALEGAVASESDKMAAAVAARSVLQVFGLSNNLQVEK